MGLDVFLQQEFNDASDRGNEVGQECVVDYTDQFTTYEIFKGKDALITWVRQHGKLDNMVIVIKRSNLGGEGVNIGDEDDWTLKVVCGEHNHPTLEYLEGHSFVGRLSKEENELLMDMSKSLVRPKDILVSIKDRDAQNVSTIRTIYNARHRGRMKEFAGRTQMQQLLHKLSEHKYVEWHISCGDTVIDLLWAHPISIEILRAFPHVLIMDCTYKTNRYRFPLLQIVGVTSTNMTFSVAFVYIEAGKEDNYIWALTRLKTLLHGYCLPGVIATDRDLALLNSIKSVFPGSQHLLCRWHINKNVLSKCKKMFESNKQWNKFNRDWNCLVSLET
ncbi:PKS-NRPS hybrid synthetase cheA-like [Malus domestica]|uniref:PKS-NRPS hybrid synthetase cheA-like n=1 Tax=Malus domestica TaxID=3750 RepID=UPI003976EF80